jgi:ribosomal-protein-alanine N-acetyltransferase
LVRKRGIVNMPFSLLQLSREQLLECADSRLPAALAARVEEGALPPPFVAARALKLVAEGRAEFWCNTFLIVRSQDQRVIGGCGFKDAPRDGRVEIGYGVAPSCRGRGAATAAVGLLLRLAFGRGVREVFAEVTPDNLASASVVRKLGFVGTGTRVDEEHQVVVQWVAKNGASGSWRR